MEDGTNLTESVNRALRVMRFTVHTGLKKTPFELQHRRKPRTELTNIVKDGKTFLSDWSELSISAPIRPKIPIYVVRDGEGEITNHIIMARNKTEEKNLAEGPKSPKKKNSVSYLFEFREKNHNKKSLEGKFQKKIQTAISGTKNTVKTDTGKTISRKFISGPLFQNERKTKREPAPMTSGEIQPKNRHCLRGLDGKYGRWDEILRDMLNGKLKIVQNRKTDSETEDDDDDEDEEMPEETGNITYDTSERNGKYVPIQTNPEDDAIQIHTEDEISGENLEHNIRRSNRKLKNRLDTVVYHIQETFGDKQKTNFMFYRKFLEQKKRDATTGSNPKAGRLPTTGPGDDTNPTINVGIKDSFRRLEKNQK